MKSTHTKPRAALAILTGGLVFAGSLPAVELLENGSFENNAGFNGNNSSFGWVSANGFTDVFDVYNYTTQVYYAGGIPAGAGEWYFHTVGLGSLPDGAIVEQTQDLVTASSGLTNGVIDSGAAQFTFSSQISGYIAGGDTAILELEFFDESDNSLGVTATLDGTTGGDDSITNTWDLFSETGVIPSGARKATVRILQATAGGSNGNDNYVDLVSLDVSTTVRPTLGIVSSGGDLIFTWASQAGKVYDLLSSIDPEADGAPSTWPVVAGQEGIAAEPDTNTLTISRPVDPTRLYVVRERNAPPPPPAFFDDFESDLGWNTGANPGDTGSTTWQRGTPVGDLGGGASEPATGANGSSNCYGTNLNAIYGSDTDIYLRSPAIDLTALNGSNTATLKLEYFVDTDLAVTNPDLGKIRVLNANNLSEQLGADLTGSAGLGGIGDNWSSYSELLPAEALGQTIVLEFQFTSNSDAQNFGGFYIDEVTVEVK